MAKNLILKEKMDYSYLIQRLSPPTGTFNPKAFGAGRKNGGFSDEEVETLSQIFWLDHMAYAEFEHGEAPEAISFLKNQDLVASFIEYLPSKTKVYYICPSNYENAVRAVLYCLIWNENAVGLMAYCGLKHRLDKKPHPDFGNNVGWLELNNGYFFFIDPAMFGRTKKMLGIS